MAAAQEFFMIASFHLTRYRPDRASYGLSRMAFDRPVLARTRGLGFYKMLGTARGATMSLGADLHRWALFAVWDDEAALEAFLGQSPIPAAWREAGHETWSVRLAYAGGHGQWGGRDPFAGMTAAAAAADQPVAVLTRAAIRLRRTGRFYRAVPAIDQALAGTDGCLAAVGIGELPVARQATFSLWRDAAAVRGFAYASGPHQAAIRRTRAEDWFSEECFARFIPYAPSGSWDGRDPLSGG
jgi:heme-degrading monooxygenase HmoA